MLIRRGVFGCVVALTLAFQAPAYGQKSVFADAPASARNQKNPYEGNASALAAGRRAYASNCLACHGRNGDGTGNIPSLKRGDVPKATPGELFWFITKGDEANGMPAWNILPARTRWQIIAYVKSLTKLTAKAAPAAAAELPAAEAPSAAAASLGPMPNPPFVDFRAESPGKVHKITPADLPAPYESKSANNGPRLVKRPDNVWPKALPGFKVELYSAGLDEPRLIRTAPNGDYFVAESRPGDIKVFRGITKDGKPEQMQVFATGLNRPFGIAFYPPGPDPQWVYVGSTDEVVRFPYKSGELRAGGPAQHIADLPGKGSGHWTRTIEFSADGKHMYVSVGSRSNVSDDEAEKDRADVLEFTPDGGNMRVYASGIRNCVGLALEPRTSKLWCSTNERDGLGDNLAPDYITHLEDGGFYGWPWFYIGGNQDPRHAGAHPELKDKVLVPDVLLQAHNASLQITFYNGKQFPAEYQGDLFGAEHGSWNRSIRVGYEIIRVPLHQSGKASGEYEDFVTGFVLDNGEVWGRPVGVTVAKDGSLLFTDDGSNSIWRVSYVGKQ